MSTTVLVTGGMGFIGSHFIRHLVREQADVRVVNLDKMTYAGNPENLADVASSNRYTFVRGDVADENLVARVFTDERPAAVVNFAAETHVDRSILSAAPFFQSNVRGVEVLLEAVRRFRIPRFVQISTDEVYGDLGAAVPPADENAPLRPSSPYAASKGAADLLCLAYVRTYGAPVVIARSTNNYGPNQFPEKLIPLLIRNALAGAPLPVYGDGGQVRDWLWVEDNVQALAAVLERGREGEIYNIGTGVGRPNLEVVRRLCEILEEETHADPARYLSLLTFVADRPGHDRRYAVDVRRTSGELRWSPATAFETGLRATVRWYLAHPQWVEHVLSGEYRTYYDTVYHREWGTRPG